jgi:hypothetical protein
MITQISSGKNGQAVFHFMNGVKLSFIWDWGTYSDNNMVRPTVYPPPKNEKWASSTVECYSTGDNPNGINEYLDKKYGGNPAAYIPVNDIPKILARADKI